MRAPDCCTSKADTHKLHLDERWLEEVAAIQNSVTEESNLIRNDGVRYRMCRPGPVFTVELFPSFSRADEDIELLFDPLDLYCQRWADTRRPATATLQTILNDTVPRAPKSARTRSPAAAGTIGPRAPERITSPASSP